MSEHPFSARVALVTGGASGIGRSTARAFVARGAAVIIADVDDRAGAETVAEISAGGGSALYVTCDVTEPGSVETLVDGVVDRYGRLDFAVNNAGLSGPMAPTADYPPAAWQRLFDVNVHGVYHCMRRELPIMVSQGHGVIVNVASIAGLNAFTYHSAYAASKHAVVGLTRTAALEYVRKGVRINAVCPGFTETPMVQNAAEENPTYTEKLFAHIPIRRLGTPEEIAAAIMYLCSDDAAFMVGQTLVVDGGILAS